MSDFTQLSQHIKHWGREIGFHQVGISDIDLAQHEKYLQQWLQQQRHGDMEYMAKHGTKRSRPDELVPGTLRAIVTRLNYMPPNDATGAQLANPQQAYIARYTLGRDYHKVIRKRLKRLAEKISGHIDEHQYRAFVDSGPVLERALAEKAGLGWIGKSTMLVNHKAGTYFFLGVLYTNLPLPTDTSQNNHCGSCQACIDVCPTAAIVAPYQLDARRCISYLTIENKGPIPLEFRKAIGNRIFGCDDCQLICPWNKFAKPGDAEFHPRHGLDTAGLTALFKWSGTEFLAKTEGSALRRTGYHGWLRNIAVALGNAPTSDSVIHALQQQVVDNSMVAEHINWALQQHVK